MMYGHALQVTQVDRECNVFKIKCRECDYDMLLYSSVPLCFASNVMNRSGTLSCLRLGKIDAC